MFEKLFEKRSSSNEEIIDWTNRESWFSWLNNSDSYSNSSKDYIYNKCLNILGETVGKLTFEIKQDTEEGEKQLEKHALYEMLRLRPNKNMSAFDCYSTLIRLYKHYGMAGLYIDKTAYGKVLGLYPVRIDSITVDNGGIINSNKSNNVYIDFTCYETQGSCFDSEIILLRDNSFNGIKGRAIRYSAKNLIESNVKANEYQNDLFANGLTNKAVVQLTSDIKEEKELRKIQDKFNRIYSNKGRIFTVPAGYNISPLNLNLADSQFVELKTLGKKDIAGVLGIPFSFIDDLKNVTENEVLTFITNTIHPILVAIEQEADYKLLTLKERENRIKARFNISGLLRTTPKTQQDIICNYVKQGVYSLNYAKKLVGAPLLEKDVTVFPSGQVTLEQLVEGKVSYVKNSLKGGEDNVEK